MPKVFTSKNQKIGEIGEHIAARYLKSKGYAVIERNYTRKWGEIDIVAKKGNMLCFIEVKSKSGLGVLYRPEENMHSFKIKRLHRTIQTYLLEKSYEGEWQLDLAVVYMDIESKKARVDLLENII